MLQSSRSCSKRAPSLWLQVAPARVYRHHQQATSLADASAITQSATFDTSADAPPLWSAGLTGAGQVLGLGDSGVDMDHCAFNDPAVSFRGFETGQSRVPQFVSETHRKLAFYYMFADGTDSMAGHGSHVAGIAVAAPLQARSKAHLTLIASCRAEIAYFCHWNRKQAGCRQRHFLDMLQRIIACTHTIYTAHA